MTLAFSVDPLRRDQGDQELGFRRCFTGSPMSSVSLAVLAPLAA